MKIPEEETINLDFGVMFVFCEGCSNRDEMRVFHPEPAGCSGIKRGDETLIVRSTTNARS